MDKKSKATPSDHAVMAAIDELQGRQQSEQAAEDAAIDALRAAASAKSNLYIQIDRLISVNEREIKFIEEQREMRIRRQREMIDLIEADCNNRVMIMAERHDLYLEMRAMLSANRPALNADPRPTTQRRGFWRRLFGRV